MVVLALAVLLFMVACGVTAATDEGAVAWASRALRTVPAIPVCGAVAAYGVLRRADRRGELLALATLGCSPARTAAFAVVGAASLSLVAAALVATRADAQAAFFPRATDASSIRVDPPGFVDDARGVHITLDGRLTADAPKHEARALDGGNGRGHGHGPIAAFVLVAFGLALALAVARPPSPKVVVMIALTSALSIVALQAAAAGLSSAMLACAPPMALLISAAVRYRAPAW
jgi:hypothetical protein